MSPRWAQPRLSYVQWLVVLPAVHVRLQYVPTLTFTLSTYVLTKACVFEHTHVGSVHQTAQILQAKCISTTDMAPTNALVIVAHHTITPGDRQNATSYRLLCNTYTHHLLLKLADGSPYKIKNREREF